MKTVFYKKVGRKYEPVSEYDSELMSAFPRGAHLVLTYPGGRSTRYNIEPKFAPMIAAGRFAEDAISKKLQESSEIRPMNYPKFTDKEQRMWKAIQGCIPKDSRTMFTYGSARDAVEAGVLAMSEEADKLLENPTVKKAYERFMMVCELAYEKKEGNNE